MVLNPYSLAQPNDSPTAISSVFEKISYAGLALVTGTKVATIFDNFAYDQNNTFINLLVVFFLVFCAIFYLSRYVQCLFRRQRRVSASLIELDAEEKWIVDFGTDEMTTDLEKETHSANKERLQGENEKLMKDARVDNFWFHTGSLLVVCTAFVLSAVFFDLLCKNFLGETLIQ